MMIVSSRVTWHSVILDDGHFMELTQLHMYPPHAAYATKPYASVLLASHSLFVSVSITTSVSGRLEQTLIQTYR